MVINCENIIKVYQGAQDLKSLDGISFQAAEGDFVALTGPSGCGKSTLLNILGLIDEPTSGSYYLYGKDTSKMNDKRRTLLRRETVGIIFQSFNLMPQLSVLENIALPLRYSGYKEKYIIDRAKHLAEQLGIKDKLDNNPLQLSGGQRQRVACARALANKPKILLADEPTGNLDSASGKDFMRIIRDLNEEGLTIIMVTHDMTLAKYAKRIVAMKDGKFL